VATPFADQQDGLSTEGAGYLEWSGREAKPTPKLENKTNTVDGKKDSPHPNKAL
jgi:hypothetical protein